jgi:hypothetical protein
MAMAHDRIGLVNPQHLYVPGRVIVMYENWKRDDANTGDGGSSSGGGAGDSNANEASTGAADDKGYVNIEHSVVFSDGTMKPLRFFEIDKARMLTDHLTASYYNSVNALVSKQQMSSSPVFSLPCL